MKQDQAVTGRWVTCWWGWMAAMLLATGPVVWAGDYRILDLTSGAMVQHADAPADLLSNPDYKRTKMVFRRIPAGTVVMGNGSFEVTLTQDYWLGVFACTQGQWETIMGSNPSRYEGFDRPVEQIAWMGNARQGTMVRAGQWPEGHPDEESFMGRLRQLTDGRYRFDLPTEAQWERAARAGTTSDFNNGENLTDRMTCVHLEGLGRYSGNFDDGRGGYTQHTAVGSYAPNAWGLYDMHGNVWEFCLDLFWTLPSQPAVDYPGNEQRVSGRAVRGGSWRESAWFNTMAIRTNQNDRRPAGSDVGFRVAIQPQP